MAILKELVVAEVVVVAFVVEVVVEQVVGAVEVVEE